MLWCNYSLQFIAICSDWPALGLCSVIHAGNEMLTDSDARDVVQGPRYVGIWAFMLTCVTRVG